MVRLKHRARSPSILWEITASATAFRVGTPFESDEHPVQQLSMDHPRPHADRVIPECQLPASQPKVFSKNYVNGNDIGVQNLIPGEKTRLKTSFRKRRSDHLHTWLAMNHQQ